MMAGSDQSIVVTAVGMMTSLGNAVMSCAAARAGIVRVHTISLDPEADEELEPLSVGCHGLRPLTDGFVGRARLLRIGALALQDLICSHGRSAGELPARTGIMVNLPSGYYESRYQNREDADLEEMQDSAEPPAEANSDARFADTLLDLAGLSGRLRHKQVVRLDQTGAAATLTMARQLLSDGVLDACIIGGIDTLVDEPVMEMLAALDLLKSTESPVGFMPGEGAAFLLVEKQVSAARRNVPILAFLGSSATGQDANHRFADLPADGRVLSDIVAGVLSAESQATATFYGCLNGDTFRALEWGMAMGRLKSRNIVPAQEILLATSFGELGAAYGFVAMGMAVRSLARGYEASGTCLIWAAADSGSRSAFTVTRDDRQEATLVKRGVSVQETRYR